MIFSCFFTDTGMEPPVLMISALLLLALASSIAVESVDPVFNDDVLGLIVFKSGLQDPKSKLSSWNEDDATPCSWDGVFCDRRSNRVAELRLDGFSLSGHIGRGVIRLQFLKVLSLSNNNFNGTIIADVTRIGTLQSIDLSHNNLTGSIPGELFQQCGSLRSVSFAGNRLTGLIPDSVSFCSSLLAVNFSSNQLSGQLPLGFWFSRPIQSIDISGNLLEGVIHDGVQSLYNLRILNLGRNRFVGRIPVDIGGCFNLRMLDLSSNFLSGGFPESMKQLSLLSSLSVSGNSFTGKIPDWIGDLQNLEKLDLSANSFVGRIPRSIGNIHSMKELNLSKNHFTGILPSSLSNFADIVVLDVSQNVLMGSFRLRSTTSEDTMFHDDYRNLQVLDLSSNAFSGQLPDDIGDFTSLRRLNMSRNHLFGSIPVTIGRLNATEVLDFSSNMLNGKIPLEIGGAVSLLELNLQKNFLTGNIPAEIGHCSSLTSLILSDNKLTGLVPSSIAKLSNLEHVDLSSNSLSGSLPKELADLSHLQNFNVSYNNLEGELPGGSYFDTIPLSFVYGNPLLCGSVVKDSCPSVHPKPIVLNPNSSTPAGASSSTYSPHKRIILSISALIAIGAAAFIAIGVVAVSLLNIHARSATQLSGSGIVISGDEEFSCSPSTDPNYGKLVIFSGEAHFITAANGLLNKESELGRGGFGVVYKTILKDGRTFAIKKLTCSGLIKSQEEFETEVKSLGKIRHTNLISLEGYYWTPSLQLLIYEYIPLGSLYHQIHDSESRNCLSWRQRFDIILGMARGLAHLHQMNIIHYNLKSTNIIIDTSLQPKVGDFGLARLLPGLDRCILSSKIQSALGYMAPEFACRSVKITEKCDVYGFGVLILEIISGRRPVEYMEDDVSVLCDIVRSALEAGEVEKCVDVRLVGFPIEEAVPLMKLGLVCASQVPSTRPDMVEVINILELIQCSSEESL